MTDRGPSDPERIRSIAVHRSDVATALEATLRSDRGVVLRVTPPFSGRMRARIHADGPGEGSSSDAGGSRDTERRSDAGENSDAEGSSNTNDVQKATAESRSESTPIRIDPADLVAEIPSYPEVDETTDDHPEADVETRRQRHAEAVEEWRERVRSSIVDSVALDVSGDATHEVDVNALG